MDETVRVCKHCGKELPTTSFLRNRWGYTNVCKQCTTQIRRDAKKNSISLDKHKVLMDSAKNAKLNLFTSRELIEELARRGYKGKLSITETKVIDISNF